MTSKEKAIEAIETLPENATLDKIVEKLRHLEAEGVAEPSTTPERPLPEGGAWDLLEHAAGSVVMPPDWASEHDHYLYGTPKRSSAV